MPAANDGTMFGGGMGARQHNATLDAKPPAAKPAGDDSAQPKSIMDDPKAMQCVDELKQMGYTADDVAQAMGDDQMGGGQAATQAAPLQIPGTM